VTTVRRSELNAHGILAAGSVMGTRTSHGDTSHGDPIKAFLQLRNMVINDRPELSRCLYAFEFDLSWPFVCISITGVGSALSEIKPAFPG